MAPLFPTLAVLLTATCEEPPSLGRNSRLPAESPTSPWWLRDAPYQNATAEPLPQSVDIAIIGAGMTGASVAYHLRRMAPAGSLDVLLLDARGASGGATGRNGGQCDPQDAWDFSDMLGSAGLEKTLAERAFQMANVELMTDFVRRRGAGAEDLRFGGAAVPFQTPADAAAGAEAVRTIHRFAARCSDPDCAAAELWDASEAANRSHSASYLGATYKSYSASLWPSKVVAGLLDAALGADVALHTHTLVRALEPGASGTWSLRTSRGTLLARRVVFATNAYSGALLEEFLELIVPVKNQVLITTPVEPLCDFLTSVNNDLEYFMQRSDGRVVVGGGRDIIPDRWVSHVDDDTILPNVTRHLMETLTTLYPQLSGRVQAEQVWSGILSNTPDGLPWVGPVPGRDGAFIAAGYNGEGMTHAFASGRAIAQMLLDLKPEPFNDAYLPSSRWHTNTSAAPKIFV